MQNELLNLASQVEEFYYNNKNEMTQKERLDFISVVAFLDRKIEEQKVMEGSNGTK
jgi:hypothetical protein